MCPFFRPRLKVCLQFPYNIIPTPKWPIGCHECILLLAQSDNNSFFSPSNLGPLRAHMLVVLPNHNTHAQARARQHVHTLTSGPFLCPSSQGPVHRNEVNPGQTVSAVRRGCVPTSGAREKECGSLKRKRKTGNGFWGSGEDICRLLRLSANCRLSNKTDACLAAGSPLSTKFEDIR